MRKERTTRLLYKADILTADIMSREKLEYYPQDRRMEIDGYSYLVEDKSDDEIKITILAKQTIYLRTIKNIIIFFLVMWLIGAAISIGYIIKLVTALSVTI